MSIFSARPDSALPGSKPASVRSSRYISLPLYIAGVAAQISGLAAVAYQLGESTFAYFTFLLTLVGAAVAFQLRRVGAPPQMIQYGILLLGLVFLYALRGAGVFGSIIPLEAQGSQEMLLVSALAFTATFCTFLWLTDEAVIFSCVWSIAMIGLTGTVNINRELIVCFVVFLAAATFLLVHQNALMQGSERVSPSGGPRSLLEWWNMLRGQLLMALIAWAASILLGFLVAIPVQMVGRNLSLGTIIQRLKVPPTPVKRAPSKPRLVFDNLGQFNVGIGPVDDDPTLRMKVLSDRPRYWRGRVYDQYTGSGWISTLTEQGEELFPTGDELSDGFSLFELPRTGRERKNVFRYTHRFSIENGISGPLYHAVEPRRIRAPVPRIIHRTDNTIGTGRGIGTEYEVDSDTVDPSPADLSKTSSDYPDEIRQKYINQGTSNDTLEALAREAVREARNNPYDRAEAIRRFIAERCTYTRDAAAVPPERDAAEFFLNESKEGYCDLYATAMAVLCRYAGLPARVATGFAPGNQATPDDQVPPVAPGDSRKWYVLRGSDMHAWTEVYFNDYGWIAFDATQDTGGTVTPSRTPEPVKKKSGWLDILKGKGLPFIFITLGVVGLVFVAINELSSRFSVPGLPFIRRQRPPSDEIAALYLNTVKQIGRRGAKRTSTMTPSEYLRAVRRDVDPDVAGALEPLTRLTEKALYAPDGLSSAESQEARKASAAVRAALKQYRSRRRGESKKDAVPA